MKKLFAILLKQFLYNKKKMSIAERREIIAILKKKRQKDKIYQRGL
jgi:hypothetical protein